jgi:hypothetical protein
MEKGGARMSWFSKKSPPKSLTLESEALLLRLLENPDGWHTETHFLVWGPVEVLVHECGIGINVERMTTAHVAGELTDNVKSHVARRYQECESRRDDKAAKYRESQADARLSAIRNAVKGKKPKAVGK